MKGIKKIILNEKGLIAILENTFKNSIFDGKISKVSKDYTGFIIEFEQEEDKKEVPNENLIVLHERQDILL